MAINYKQIAGIAAPVLTLEHFVLKQFEHWYDIHKRNKHIKGLLTDKSADKGELVPVIKGHTNEYNLDNVDLQLVSEDVKSALSPIIANAIQDGIILKTGHELLRCVNIPKDVLAGWKGQSDLFHGYRVDGNKFAEQGKFVSAQFPTPLFAFQMASMVTGLYFQSVISEQLSIINKKLDFLVDDVLDKDQATLKSIFNWLNDKRQLSSFNECEISHAEGYLVEIDKIREAYRAKFNRIDIKSGYVFGPNKTEMEKWKKAVENSKLVEILNVAYTAEVEYLLVNMLLYKMLDSAKTATEARKQQCHNRHNPYFFLFYSEKYHELKVKLETHMTTLSKDAELYRDSTKEMGDTVLNQLQTIERNFSKIGGELTPIMCLAVKDGECMGYYQPKIQSK